MALITSAMNTFNASNKKPVSSQGQYIGSQIEDDFLPELSRLCRDFDLHVLPWKEGDAAKNGANGYAYRLANSLCEEPKKLEDFQFLSPPFSSMKQLEMYVFENMVDILHNYLFEGEEA